MQFKSTLAALVFALLAVPVFCASSGAAELTETWTDTIRMQRDGSLDVTENIAQDFGTAKRHGIIRTIPVDFESRDGKPYRTDLRLLSVEDGQHDSRQYTIAHHENDIVITIGDPSELLTGRQTFVIHYTLRRAIHFFDDKPEVYFNAIDDQWKFPILSASALLYLPPGVDLTKLKLDAWQGAAGSEKRAEILIAADGVAYQARNLQPGEGLTIAAQLPADSMPLPSRAQEAIWFLEDWWTAFLIPLSVFTCMWLVWWGSGRDDDAGKPIAVEWEPVKELTPAEVGTLVDERVDMQDILSILVDLAARGFLKIKEIEDTKLVMFTTKDYEFTRLRAAGSPECEALTEYERLFMQSVFGMGTAVGTTRRLSDLKGSFSYDLNNIRSAIYRAMVTKRLFHKNPEEVRSGYVGIAIAVVLAGICALAAKHYPSAFGLLAGALVIFGWVRAMPARTAAGSKKTRESLGFQRFVRMSEKERIRVLAKDDPTIFGRLLPYAMVLGAADQWAEAFKDIMTQPPDWYEPYGYGSPDYSFSTHGFVHDLGGGLHTMEQTFSTRSASAALEGTERRSD
ncbi:MAG TPA: DUF2207 domain-containing protein [Planktothrix sp.]